MPDRITQALLPPVAGPQLAAPALPEPRFDLAVTNAPAAQVFHAIASGSRYSMLLPPVLPGTVSVNLKETTVREALDVMRELYGFEYRTTRRPALHSGGWPLSNTTRQTPGACCRQTLPPP